jgi:hypothetical protein
VPPSAGTIANRRIDADRVENPAASRRSARRPSTANREAVRIATSVPVSITAVSRTSRSSGSAFGGSSSG